MIESFEPIASKNSKILILGSMPSVISLNRHQYYGNRQNAFWKIIFELFDEELADDYEKKKNLLIENRIALWDVIRICERDGSSDSNIKNEEANDFETFLIRKKTSKQFFLMAKKQKKFLKRK